MQHITMTTHKLGSQKLDVVSKLKTVRYGSSLLPSESGTGVISSLKT